MADKENKLILYKDDEGKLSVNTLFADEDVWLTQAQLVEIYQSSKSNISEHLKNIFEDKELDKEVVVRKFRTTTQHGAIEGKTQTHEVLHYNLDVIIALGYRVQSPIAVRFRRWATRLLHEYIQKGFTMADWVAALDDQILRLRKNILEGSGTVSHQEAIEKAEREFEIYCEREMRMLESDFDKAVKGLLDFKNNPGNKEEA